MPGTPAPRKGSSSPNAPNAPQAPAGEAPSPPTVPVTPVRRLLSVAIAGFAVLVAVGLVLGALTTGVGPARIPYATVVLGVQTLYVLALTVAMRPPDGVVVAAVGLAVACTTAVIAVVPDQATVTPFGYVGAAGFVAAVGGQLVRREGRLRLPETFVSAFLAVAGVLAYGTLVVLTRLPSGTQAIMVGMSAAAVALIVARLADAVVPLPRLAPQVPRGASGIVAGAMLGTATAAVLGSYIRGFEPGSGALLGLAAAVAAVSADVTTGYAEAGRRPPGEPPTMWVARHLQGPLAAYGTAAPVVYLASVVFFVPRYF